MLSVTRSFINLKETYKMSWTVVLHKTDNVLYFGGVRLIAKQIVVWKVVTKTILD